MALQTYTLTGDLSSLLGDTFNVTRTKAWIESSVGDDGVIYDRANDRVLLGDEDISLAADGTFSVSGLIGFANLAADVNPTGIQYRVWVAFPTARSREIASWNSGWFSMTANANISDVAPDQYLPPTYQAAFTQQITDYLAAVQNLRDQTQALRDQAAGYLVTALNTTDSQTTLLLSTTTSTSYAAAVLLAQKSLVPYTLMRVI